MPAKPSGITRNRLKRRLAVTLAGARAGTRILGQRSTDWLVSREQREQQRGALLQREAQQFVHTLGELKGSYVKIGQMLALFGEHLLPAELTEALHELESNTPPLPWAALEPQVREALGSSFQDLDIDTEPLAAASLGQVHRATVRASGEQLCLKILYPGVRETIDSDFNDVLQMLRLASWLHSGREVNAWLEEIRQLLHDEVDYLREARITADIRNRLAGDDRFVVPRVYTEYSSNNVLALSYEGGSDPGSAEVAAISLTRRTQLAQAMLDLFMTEIFDWGVMQTDPNFGNYRLRLSADADQLVLLDFGAVRELPRVFLQPLRRTIASAMDNNQTAVISGVIELNCLREDHPDSAKQSFADFCCALLEPLRRDLSAVPDFALNSRGEYRWGQSKLIRRAAKLAAQSAFTPYFTLPPKEFALIARKLTGVFTFIAVLDAEFNGYPILQNAIDRWHRKES